MESYYRKDEVLREPARRVGEALKDCNGVMEEVIALMEDLEDSNSSPETHLEKDERNKWNHFASEAQTNYEDAEYILELVDYQIPFNKKDRTETGDINWENPSPENQIFEAYREHETKRKEGNKYADKNGFQLMMNEALRYRSLMDKAQKFDLPSSRPYPSIDDAEIIESPDKQH
jgi:hypothetical protein